MSKLSLSGMGPQFEAPSPDDNMRRVHETLRKTVRDQGQVMSLTLSNNALLWEERKQTKALIEQLRADLADAQRLLASAREELVKLSTPEHRNLHELRLQNEELERINAGLKKALQLHLVDAIDPAELKERLAKLELQRNELANVQPSELMRRQDERAAASAAGIGPDTEPA